MIKKNTYAISHETEISLPQVCMEGWENMTPHQKGRYCDSCQKEIVDFTKYSKAEMEEILVNHLIERKPICGHFSPQQLNLAKQTAYSFRPDQLRFSKMEVFIFAFIFAFILGGVTGCTVSRKSFEITLSKEVSGHLFNFRSNCPTVHIEGLPVVKYEPIVKDTIVNIYFETSDHYLDQADMKEMNYLIQRLEVNKKENISFSIIIVGHTDYVGSFRMNQELSLKRAEAVRKFLLDFAQTRRIRNLEIKDVRAVGYQFPASDNETPEGRSLNRRVEIIIDIEEDK